jgi:hypothetical protein
MAHHLLKRERLVVTSYVTIRAWLIEEPIAGSIKLSCQL